MTQNPIGSSVLSVRFSTRFGALGIRKYPDIGYPDIGYGRALYSYQDMQILLDTPVNINRKKKKKKKKMLYKKAAPSRIEPHFKDFRFPLDFFKKKDLKRVCRLIFKQQHTLFENSYCIVNILGKFLCKIVFNIYFLLFFCLF